LSDTTEIFLASFAFSALAGLAAMLRNETPISFTRIIAAILNSGLLGLGMCLLWYKKFSDNIPFLLGVCLLVGLGGMTSVDFVLKVLRSGGLSIKVGNDGGVELPEGKSK
jgi:CHASE2 domain-containing sensor protein